ncbi:TransThyretin-Related family domain [Caenorhabditis elegans]|uniref:TransThyretin-Related family domain n=1 Tax=Caenorhabditis elegans TaxID=6239 RepID=V6CLT2_CAEEL|nr:TransThyretin-Related family domain [Caenorhabditis elegans]CDK13569.1 TransThyretin-Related family domain [Caenorhabditis elegans]|eukprot:NP_001293817.1 Uncharacterized protein CELE_F38A5.22 [Caenorhabditis elegans]
MQKLPLFILILFLPIFLTTKPTDFSVRITGRLICHEEPYANHIYIPFDVFYENVLFHGNYSTRWTDKDGNFDYSCYVKNVERYIITPYIVIFHRCWERKVVPHRCDRMIVWPIPPMNLTFNSIIPDDKRTFHIGLLELRYKHQREVVKKCGLPG